MNRPECNRPDRDPRRVAMRDWVRARCGADAGIAAVSADASFRRYYRVRCDRGSYIVMDAPPELEDCRPFLDVARRLLACGVHVPRVLDSDPEQGFLLLSDLGQRSYLDVLDPGNADALYGDAVETLLRMQRWADAAGLPLYDAGRLQEEMQLFPEWYLGRHLGLDLSAAERTDLAAAFQALTTRALNQSRVFVHRDYMPRNLMVTQPNPGVLDFQDAVLGPIAYDVISLFKDAFISWPEHRLQVWIKRYWRAGRAQGMPLPADLADFRADLDWMGVQRHLKVLGVFARIRYRDGKPHYLEDAPRFIDYVTTVAARHPELAALLDLFRRRVLPAAEPSRA